MTVSVVIPIYDEQENILPLYQDLRRELDRAEKPYEILFVDDGSQDGSVEQLKSIAAEDPSVKIIEFRRNYGQTAALSAGIEHASGDVIVTLDGDQQNDPADIPMMLAKLAEGFDLVQGWRKDRQDAFWNRRLPSKIANRLISRVTGFPVHDLGCTLKAFRREIGRELPLYGEMHRFIPILAHWRGARCTEVVTRHHPRRLGASKYGISRLGRVLLDLLTVKFLIQYLVSPMRLFGGFAFGCLLLGALSGAATVWAKFAYQVDMTGNPLLLLTVFAWLVSVQLFSLGMLGEMCARVYFESQDQQPYAIRELINFEDSVISANRLVSPRRAA